MSMSKNIPSRNKQNTGKGKNSGKGGGGKGGKGKGRLKAPNPEKQYRQDANIAARMQFRPQFQDLNRELESETRNASRIPDYFQQYQDTLRNSAASTQQGFETAAHGIETRNDTSTAIDLNQQQKMRNEAQNAAGISGGVADTSVSQEAILAALSRKAQSDEAAARLRAMGASHGATFGQLQATGQGAQIAAQNDARLAIKDTNRDIRELKGARGDYKAAYITDARNAAREFGLKQQALGVQASNNKLDYKASVGNNKRTTQQSAANAQLGAATTRRGQDLSHADRLASLAARGGKGGSGTKGLSTTDKRAYQTQLALGKQLARGGAPISEIRSAFVADKTPAWIVKRVIPQLGKYVKGNKRTTGAAAVGANVAGGTKAVKKARKHG